MALIFQRLARNFVKNGYFPTDAETIGRVLSMLEARETGTMRILDPCAGEGVALAECKHHLGPAHVEAFGVEFESERAWHAKQLLDRVIYGDFQETIITPRSFGLIWLNPPYGDLVSDQGATGDSSNGRQRLEKLFYEQAIRLLQPDGILVLIVPHYSLDREFAGWIAKHLDHVAVYRDAEATYKQAVVVGVRRRSPGRAAELREIRDALALICSGENTEPLPMNWPGDPYRAPDAVNTQFRFHAVKVDAAQLREDITRFPCLWPQFDLHLGAVDKTHRPPLRALSRWHLALSLAAGQVSGVVRSNDGGRVYVIKGDTFKKKKVTTVIEETESGAITEIRTTTDVFAPSIRALDFTPGSPMFGKALVIQ